MAHGARLYPDTFYVNGAAIPAGYFVSVETAQQNLLNGDTGQTNTPIREAPGRWIDPTTAPLWQPSTGYVPGNLVQPSPPNGFIYATLSTGNSGAAAPAWNTVIDSVTTDGASQSWTCVATTYVSAAELQAFDAALKAIINGDDGGCWAPSNLITIAGSGLQVTGPTVVARGGLLTMTVAGATVQLNDNDFPLYGPTHAGRIRVFAQPCALGRRIPSLGWRSRWSDGAVQSVAPVIDQSDGNGPQPARLWVPVRCVHGATLSTLTVNFRVGWPHAQLPPSMPKARVVRMTASGQPQPLTSSASGADSNGYVSMAAPSSVAAWSPGAGKQQLVIACDQNNVIDITQYEYFVEIVEESGMSGYPWSLVALQPVAVVGINTAFGGGAPHGNPTCDGVVTTPGMRVLLVSSSAPQFNGVWVAGNGVNYWARAGDFDAFTQGLLVPVTQGNGFGGTLLQASSSVASWTSNNMPVDVFTWSASNAYQSPDNGWNVIPSSPNGYYYTIQKVSGTGTSGASEPTWPTTIGATVIDNPGTNQVVWVCTGKTAASVNFVTPAQQDTETAQLAGTGLFAHGNIWQSVVPTFTNIQSAAWQ